MEVDRILDQIESIGQHSIHFDLAKFRRETCERRVSKLTVTRSAFLDMTAIADMVTIEKYGPHAKVQTRELGKILGIPVVIEDHQRVPYVVHYVSGDPRAF